jgi:hypothetical protein
MEELCELIVIGTDDLGDNLIQIQIGEALRLRGARKTCSIIRLGEQNAVETRHLAAYLPFSRDSSTL